MAPLREGMLWPLHVKPQPDELFSSWLIRLAHAHGYKVETMCRHLFGQGHALWSRDIDKCVSDDVLTKMAAVSGATLEKIRVTTLLALEGYLTEKIVIHGANKWIVPLGIVHRRRKIPGLMYCPVCLQEDHIPYYRRRWRLAFVTVCTKHAIQLLDRCGACGAVIAPHRVDINSGTFVSSNSLIGCCYACSKPLANSHASPAHSRVVAQQLNFETILECGYARLLDNDSLYSHLFFDGVRALVSGLSSKAFKVRINADLNANSEGHNQRSFEAAGVESRYLMMLSLTAILDNWPNSFIQFAAKSNVRYSDLMRDHRDLPFWYEDVLIRETFRPYLPLNQEHAHSIASATRNKFGKFKVGYARSLSGRDLGENSKRYLPQLTEADAETILRSLNSEIEQGKNAGGMLLQRDKVMAGLIRFSHLALSEVPDLRTVDLRSYGPPGCLGLSSWPITTDEMSAWLHWYVKEVRPFFLKGYDEGHLFLAQNGQPLKRSAIGDRLKKVIARANRMSTCFDAKNWSSSRRTKSVAVAHPVSKGESKNE